MSGAVVLLLAALGVAVVRQSLGFVRFRARVRAALDATPDVRCRRSTSRGLAVTVSGYSLELDLIPAYLYLRLRRAGERALTDEITDALRGRLPPGPIPPLLLVRDRVLPVLKRTDALPPEHGYVAENVLARRELDREIAIAYVVEGQFQMTYVTRGMLAAWAMDGPSLHHLAIENLRARTRHVLEEIGGPREDYAALDGYDAARLLVADLLVPPEVADPVFAIPDEHRCFLGPADRQEDLRARAGQAYRTSQRPLTTALYRWNGTAPRRVE